MTHSYMLPNILGMPSADIQIFSRILSFVKKGLTHKSEYIRFFFKHCIYYFNSFICRNVYSICHKINLTIQDLEFKSQSWLKNKVKSLITVDDWKCGMIRELLMCRDGEADCGLDDYELKFILQELCVN